MVFWDHGDRRVLKDTSRYPVTVAGYLFRGMKLTRSLLDRNSAEAYRDGPPPMAIPAVKQSTITGWFSCYATRAPLKSRQVVQALGMPASACWKVDIRSSISLHRQ